MIKLYVYTLTAMFVYQLGVFIVHPNIWSSAIGFSGLTLVAIMQYIKHRFGYYENRPARADVTYYISGTTVLLIALIFHWAMYQ